MLNLQTGQYHALNESGGTMFEVLSTGEPFAVVAHKVAEHYEIPQATAERDLARFCASLFDRGLLEAAEPAQA